MGALRFDSGRVCLDLVATRGGPTAAERLYSGESLREWLYEAGLVPQGTPVEVDEDWLGPFTALRALLARCADARDIEVSGAGLEDAFLTLTTTPAATTADTTSDNRSTAAQELSA